MAATIIAALRKNRKGTDCDNITMHTQDLRKPMPSEEEALYSGQLLKSPLYSRGSKWRGMYCVVTDEILAMAKNATDNTMIDMIPLHEVSAILLKGFPTTDHSKVATGLFAGLPSLPKSTKSPTAKRPTNLQENEFPDISKLAGTDPAGPGNEEEEERTIEIKTQERGHNQGHTVISLSKSAAYNSILIPDTK